MTQSDLARLCDLVRGVSRLALGVLGVATYLLVRPVVRLVRGRGAGAGQPSGRVRRLSTQRRAG